MSNGLIPDDKAAETWKAAAKLFWKLWIEACDAAAFYESELDKIQPHYAKKLRYDNLMMTMQNDAQHYREAARDELSE